MENGQSESQRTAHGRGARKTFINTNCTLDGSQHHCKRVAQRAGWRRGASRNATRRAQRFFPCERSAACRRSATLLKGTKCLLVAQQRVQQHNSAPATLGASISQQRAARQYAFNPAALHCPQSQETSPQSTTIAPIAHSSSSLTVRMKCDRVPTRG